YRTPPQAALTATPIRPGALPGPDGRQATGVRLTRSELYFNEARMRALQPLAGGAGHRQYRQLAAHALNPAQTKKGTFCKVPFF
ncbi:MAG: hypothetical protein ACN6OP_10015, partial [Pseudomonadales bacterium]